MVFLFQNKMNEFYMLELLGFSSEKQKSKYHHLIIHWVSLSTKYQLKQTILNFWTKFAQKRNFHPETEKVNITVNFKISK